MSETQSPHKHTNRLIHETSPYLLQHAHNPVDWYPWGEEALRKAQQEDKPILLSIGYSACHWCHVMERESFENEQIAAIMNQYFISIKVDREERPDLDNVYMQAVQAMTQHGGWPMTVFLLPDERPFYGGTYFPPYDRSYGGNASMPGFSSVLLRLAKAYKEHRSEVEKQATELAEFLKHHSNVPLRSRSNNLSHASQLTLLLTASRELAEAFDKVDGGFGAAPKFPNTMVLEFLLRVHLHLRDGELLTNRSGGVPLNWRWWNYLYNAWRMEVSMTSLEVAFIAIPLMTNGWFLTLRRCSTITHYSVASTSIPILSRASHSIVAL